MITIGLQITCYRNTASTNDKLTFIVIFVGTHKSKSFWTSTEKSWSVKIKKTRLRPGDLFHRGQWRRLQHLEMWPTSNWWVPSLVHWIHPQHQSPVIIVPWPRVVCWTPTSSLLAVNSQDKTMNSVISVQAKVTDSTRILCPEPYATVTCRLLFQQETTPICLWARLILKIYKVCRSRSSLTM